MTSTVPRPTRTYVLTGLIAVQALCAAFFLWDAAEDYAALGSYALDRHLIIEGIATLSLILAIGFEVGQLVRLIRRERHMIRGLSVAARAMHEIIEEHFAEWRLTPAEQDVATFLIKGSDIAEIARLRGSAEGTVKAHLNAIYRKAGVSGRPGLVSLLIEDLMTEPLMGRAERTREAQDRGGAKDRSGNDGAIG